MASERVARPRAPPFIDPPGYARHRPEETLLYQLVERHYPEYAPCRRRRRGGSKYLSAAMAREARFSAALLAGEMPQGVDAAFGAARASLFPSKADDLAAVCSCPDWAAPCKHIAATHYVLGEAFDRDPFLLFQLRGRDKLQVIEALRVARTPAPALPRSPAPRKGGRTRKAAVAAPAGWPARESLQALRVADYGKARTTLPPFRLAFASPQHSGSVLEHLGKPADWAAATSPADSLGAMIRAGAQRAREWALAEALPTLETADGSPPRSFKGAFD
jgi:uncharacterized Zn finger protein